MKVVYCHNRKYDVVDNFPDIGGMENLVLSARGGTTVAMESIPSWILDMICQGDSIVRKVGIARCSDDDNYCKKRGREIAESRLKQTSLTVVNIVRIAKFVTVFFEDENDNLFEVKTSGDPQCARLVRMLDDN